MRNEIFQGRDYPDYRDEEEVPLEPEKWYWWNVEDGGLTNDIAHGPFDTYSAANADWIANTDFDDPTEEDLANASDDEDDNEPFYEFHGEYGDDDE